MLAIYKETQHAIPVMNLDDVIEWKTVEDIKRYIEPIINDHFIMTCKLNHFVPFSIAKANDAIPNPIEIYNLMPINYTKGTTRNQILVNVDVYLWSIYLAPMMLFFKEDFKESKNEHGLLVYTKPIMLSELLGKQLKKDNKITTLSIMIMDNTKDASKYDMIKLVSFSSSDDNISAIGEFTTYRNENKILSSSKRIIRLRGYEINHNFEFTFADSLLRIFGKKNIDTEMMDDPNTIFIELDYSKKSVKKIEAIDQNNIVGNIKTAIVDLYNLSMLEQVEDD